MGQEQLTNKEGMGEQAFGNQRFNPVQQKDRVGAKFEQQNAVNPAYAKGGSGKQENPGRPV